MYAAKDCIKLQEPAQESFLSRSRYTVGFGISDTLIVHESRTHERLSDSKTHEYVSQPRTHERLSECYMEMIRMTY